GVTLALASAQRTADSGTPGGSSMTSAVDVRHGSLDIAPGAVVDQVFANTTTSVRDLAVRNSPSGEAQPRWLSNDEWTSLDTTAVGSLLGWPADLLNVTSQERGDPDALEAFFAGEVAPGNHFRF